MEDPKDQPATPAEPETGTSVSEAADPPHSSDADIYGDGYPTELDPEADQGAPEQALTVTRDGEETAVAPPPVLQQAAPPGDDGPPPDSTSDDDGDDEEDHMAKMSFLEHLQELRDRIIRALIGVAAGCAVGLYFSDEIFAGISKPVADVLRKMGLSDKLVFTAPGDAFNVYLQIGLVAGLFIASPWVLYQVWAFIAPGLYQKERKYAVPFIFFCSGLFMAGGAFAYFIAFPYALEFLLKMGGEHMTPFITAKEYLDLFTTIILGLGIVFEMPVLILFLAILGIVTPGFLLRNFRYAVLVITIIAALITPTTDVTNLVLFTVPMLGLYLLGTALAWLVWRGRRKREAQS